MCLRHDAICSRLVQLSSLRENAENDTTAGQVSACSRISALSTSLCIHEGVSTCRKLHRKIRDNAISLHTNRDDVIIDSCRLFLHSAALQAALVAY